MRDIKDTVHSLRAEILAELDSGLKDLELQPMTTSDMDNDNTSATLNMRKAAYCTGVWAEIYTEQHFIKWCK